MASLAELEDALVNADKAGDTEAARALAGEITRLRASPSPEATAPKEKTAMDRFNENAVRALKMTPMGIAHTIGSKATEALDKASYELGGMATDKAAAAGLEPETAAKIGWAANVAPQAAVAFATGGPLKAAAPMLESAAQRVMQMALKPSKAARDSGDAAKAIDYLLERGTSISKGNVEALTSHINSLDESLTSAIQNSTSKVSTAVFKNAKDAIDKFRDGLDHASNSQAIREEVAKFINHPNVQGAFDIPVQIAQRMKRAIYKEVGDKGYGIGLKPDAEREGKKAIANALKEAIAEAEPSTAGINKEMGSAINARDLMADRVSQAGNNNLINFGWLKPSTMIPYMMEKSPWVASNAARALYAGAEQIPATAARIGSAGLLAGQSALRQMGILKRTSWYGEDQGGSGY